MDIFLFNRKLMWVVVPLVFWSCIVLFGALDEGKGKDGGPGLRVSLERRGVRLPGRLVSINEDAEGNLSIELAVRRQLDGYALGPDGQPMDNLPEGLEITYIEDDPQREHAPPSISMHSGINEPQEFLRGHLRLLNGEKFVVRINRIGLQVIPKGEGFDQNRLVQEMQRRMDRKLDKPRRGGRPQGGPGGRQPEPGRGGPSPE